MKETNRQLTNHDLAKPKQLTNNINGMYICNM